MRTKVAFFSLLLFAITFSSCKKDDPDPCANVTCLNGGTCVNGSCDCPEGYSGPDCSNQVTPTKIRISKIDVTSFPQYDNGATWDLNSGPDIYVKIVKGNSVIHSFKDDYYPNVEAGTTYSFMPSLPIEISDPLSQYGYELYDGDDITNDQYMGGYDAIIYNNTNGFPNQITMSMSGYDVEFVLYVTYVF